MEHRQGDRAENVESSEHLRRWKGGEIRGEGRWREERNRGWNAVRGDGEWGPYPTAARAWTGRSKAAKSYTGLERAWCGVGGAWNAQVGGVRDKICGERGEPRRVRGELRGGTGQGDGVQLEQGAGSVCDSKQKPRDLPELLERNEPRLAMAVSD
jgi:hypothetical protein